jgi:membrane dipeptidase
MPWFDGHLDLAWLARSGRDLRRPAPPGGCASLPDLRRARVEGVLGTIYVEPGGGDDAAEAEAQLEVYRGLEAAGEIVLARVGGDLAGRGDGRIRVVLLMEGAEPIRSPAGAAAWFAAGLRAVGLAWATGSRYAGGNRRPGPLTAPGTELVRALDRLGAVHDASHLCDEALDGLFAEARGPIVASHSNCRALAGDDERHLRDEHIVEIGRRGGIVGLNLYSRFLVPARRATIDDCVAHVERVAGLMNHRRGVALGSDMDGGFGTGDLPEGLDHPCLLDRLADALRRAHWPEPDVEGFMHGNWRRFLEGALPRR